MKPLTITKPILCPECKIRPVQDGREMCNRCFEAAFQRANREDRNIDVNATKVIPPGSYFE